MGFAQYSALWRIREVRRALLIGLVMRIPLWAAGVIITLHVVTRLDRSYTAAGVVIAAQTIAIAISGPWRGRRLDRLGLRKALAPSLVVLTACWSIAPWLDFYPFAALVFVSGLFLIPSFSILRQVMISHVPEEQRKSVLVLDSVFTEISFMVGPVLGVLMATAIRTDLALCIAELLAVAGGAVLWWLNPPMGQDEDERSVRHPLRSWLTPTVVAILAASMAACLVLTGEDLGVVAALRALDQPHLIGWMLAIWGAGSAIGGLAYGALKRHPSTMTLLTLLGLTTGAVALAPDLVFFGIALFLSGLFCAPTITAAVDALTRAVPVAVRGEAMGWHGSSMTAGGAAGAPLIGAMLDGYGWESGFLVAGLIGVVIGVIGIPLMRSQSRVHAESGEDLARRLGAVERVEMQTRGAAGE